MALIPGNLLTLNQQSVETDIDNWGNYKPSSSAVAVSTTQALDGAQSIRCTANATNNDAMCSLTSPGSVPLVTAGTTYTFSYWVYSPRAVNYACLVEWWNAADTTYISDNGVVGSTAVPANTWSQVSVQQTAAASSGSARIYIMRTTGLSSGDLVYFDQVFFGVPVVSVVRPNIITTALRRSSTW